MKTKIYIDDDIAKDFGDSDVLTNAHQIDIRRLRERGFIIDEFQQSGYKIFDREIQLNEGDHVAIGFSTKVVTYKLYDPEEDILIYYTEEY